MLNLTEKEIRDDADRHGPELADALVNLWKKGTIVAYERDAVGKIVWRHVDNVPKQ